MLQWLLPILTWILPAQFPVPFMGNSYILSICRDQPLDLYSLDEASGTTAHDRCGRGTNGLYGGSGGGGTPWLYRQSGPALFNNGVVQIDGGTLAQGSLVQVSDPQIYFDSTNAFSLEGWFKTTSVNSAGVMFSNLVQNNPTANAFRGYDLIVASPATTKYQIALISNNATNNQIICSYDVGATLLDGAWHMVVWTYDGSKTAAGNKLYHDGVAKTQSCTFNGLTGSITSGTENPVIMGTRYASLWFNNGSQISQMAFYGYVLSQAQVTNHYNAGTIW